MGERWRSAGSSGALGRAPPSARPGQVRPLPTGHSAAVNDRELIGDPEPKRWAQLALFGSQPRSAARDPGHAGHLVEPTPCRSVLVPVRRAFILIPPTKERLFASLWSLNPPKRIWCPAPCQLQGTTPKDDADTDAARPIGNRRLSPVPRPPVSNPVAAARVRSRQFASVYRWPSPGSVAQLQGDPEGRSRPRPTTLLTDQARPRARDY
jgi:hypothetical protein